MSEPSGRDCPLCHEPNMLPYEPKRELFGKKTKVLPGLPFEVEVYLCHTCGHIELKAPDSVYEKEEGPSPNGDSGAPVLNEKGDLIGFQIAGSGKTKIISPARFLKELS